MIRCTGITFRGHILQVNTILLCDRFGSLYGDFWLGNSVISALTRQAEYQLKIDITDWDNEQTTHLYNKFMVGGQETSYKLTIADYQ